MPHAIAFYTLSGLMLAAALCVVASRQPVYSVLALLAAMFCMAGLFVMLGAYFLAAVQILLYAGAVLVLFLFVVMLLNLGPEALPPVRLNLRVVIGGMAALVIFLQLCAILRASDSTPSQATTPRVTWQMPDGSTRSMEAHPWPSEAPATPSASAESGSVREIGDQLFSKFLLPFELTSFLILAAIIAAVTLAKDALKRPQADR